MTLRRTIMLVATALATALAVVAADTDRPLVAKFFAEAPDWMFEVLPANTRLDMLDYYSAGISRGSTNSFGADCYVTDLGDTSISMVSGTGISHQVFQLDRAGAPVFGVIETVATPVDDATVAFYDSSWRPLASAVFTSPSLADWIAPGAAKRAAELRDKLPFMLVSYEYDTATGTLTLTNNMESYFTGDEYPDGLLPKITYKWDGKKFNRQK